MTRTKKLISLTIILAVLAGGSYAVTKLTEQENEEVADTSAVIYTANEDSISELSWAYGEEALTFQYDGENWVYAEDKEFPLDDTYLSEMLTALSEVTASKTISDAADLSEYGLDEPICTVTVLDESTTTLIFGNETGLGGERYCSFGDGNVYLVDSAIIDNFSYGLYDLVQMETLPSSDEIENFIVSAEQKLDILYQENSGLAYSNQYVWFMKEKEEYITLDTELTENLIDSITGLNWLSVAAYHADNEQLAEYGLKTPDVSVELKTDTNKYTLNLGMGDNGSCYARLGNSSIVYTIDSTIYDSLLYVTSNDLLPDEPLLMDWNSVTVIEILLNGESYMLTKEIQEVSSDDETSTDAESDTENKAIWLLDGTEIAIESVLEQLTSLTSDGYATGIVPERSEEISFIIHQDSENFPEITLTFYTYNSTSCLTTLNDNSTVFVTREDVISIVEAINALVLGE